MATRHTWAGWAVALAAVLLAAPGCSSKPEPSQGKTGQAAEKGVSIAPSSSQAEPAKGDTGQTTKKDVSVVPSSSQAEAPKELTLDLGGGVTMKLALIPAGKFMMGEGKDQHEVTLSKPFYVGLTEVTQAQYQAIMGTNPSIFKGATNPVHYVSWEDATEFCKRLSEKTRQAVRLPTEAQWEYACRAGTATAFSFGDADSTLGDYAWNVANSGGKTQPVGQRKPNAWGLYDMHGNVWEWCADWYGEYPNGPLTDPQVPAPGTDRVLRGGCWDGNPYYCRSAASRYITALDNRSHYFGFRVVVPVGPGLQ